MIGHLLIIICGFLLVACQAPISQSNLYWGDYSQTLYKVKKEPGEESLQAHRQTLLEIVEESTNRNLRVPPGIYAELGVLALDRGDRAEAENYFSLEQQTYPESSVLLNRVLSGG